VTDSLDWTPAPLPAPVTLQGRTVTLAPLSAALHTEALWLAFQGPELNWSWLADSAPLSEPALRTSLAAKEAGSSALFFAIVPVKTGLPAGYFSLMRIEPAHGVIEVGAVTFSAALQRTTEATEAIYLLIRHVFDDLGYRRLEWKCNAENAPSRRAALRLGFSFEGIFRQHMVVKGANRDTAWFSMIDSEWPDRKPAFQRWLDLGNFDDSGKQRKTLEACRQDKTGNADPSLRTG